MTTRSEAKSRGAYYTPTEVARSLVSWVVQRPSDRMLDPACGDGQFLQFHSNSTGVECDPHAAVIASQRARGSLIQVGDFFEWAEKTSQRFDCAAGNPPFIRYQRFAGKLRERALQLCAKSGANLSALSASWAPFLVVVSSLLKTGGRLGFVVPSEIGHASYSAEILKYLCNSFQKVAVVAVREPLFPKLSQDVWLLYASGYGGKTDLIHFTRRDKFNASSHPPKPELTNPCIGLEPMVISAETFFAAEKRTGYI
jgi:adenine-specific DNA-methyltransferase